jgi:hypothetical protein
VRARLVAIVLLFSGLAHAGPEISMRDFAGGQIKKGVRTIGMGGDGATTGNYALVYKDTGTALFDYGVVRYSDTGNVFTFKAVGFTTPAFWDDAAFYAIAISQQGTDLHVWSMTPPSAAKPPSLGDGGTSSVFVKFAKPISHVLSIGFMGAWENSQMTLIPDDGSPPIRYQTSYRPSGGLGLHWHPSSDFQAGARVILNHDREYRDDASGTHGGLNRSYEYRLGAAWSPWKGALLDAGASALDRSNELENTHAFKIYPTVGAEQALVPQRVWARGGLDETTWTTGMSLSVRPFRIDLAYLYNLASARTGDVFGKRNASLIGTLTLDYESMLGKRKP